MTTTPMTEKPYESYDFCKPLPFAGELEQMLIEWLQSAAEMAPKKWAKHMAFPVDMSFRQLEVLHLSEGLARMPDPAVGFHVPIQGMKVTTLLVLPRPLALALVTQMLGELCKELPEDREMTVVEESLAEFLVEGHLVASLEETWSGAESIRFGSLKKEAHPRYTRVFPLDENLAFCTFSIQGPFGKHECYWLTPQKRFLDELFAPTGPGRKVVKESTARPQLEGLVRELPVEVSVLLGMVELPFTEVAKLRPGDVVILNQQVTEPLTATVAGEKKFLVWPGRVGSQPAVQIEASTED